MSRGFRTILLVFACLLLGAFVVRYLVIPGFGPSLLARLLTRWGVTESVIDDVSLAPGGMKIGHASLTWKPQQKESPSMLGKIEALQFSGTIGSLSNGRFSNASADTVSFEIVAGAPSQEPDLGVQAVWAGALRLFPPLTTAQIKNFSVLWSDPATGHSLRLRGRAVFDEPSLTLHPGALLTFNANGQDSIQAELTTVLKMSRSSDGQDISIAPFGLRVAPFSTSQGVRLDGLELQSEQFLLMQQGASGKAKLKGQFGLPDRPELKFSPFELAAELQFLPSGPLIPRAEVEFKMAKLEAVVPFSNLYARFLVIPHGNSAAAATISLHEAGVAALGGFVTTSNVDLDLSAKKFETLLQLKAISLKDLFEVYPDSRVTGSGTLDGTIKVQGRPGALNAEGALDARPPGGVLNGDLSSWSAAHPDNQGIAFAARALQNFHYSGLHSGVEYSELGQLVLRVELKGSNPELEQGRAVNVNVAIEENLPALMKTLKLMSQGPEGLENIGK